MNRLHALQKLSTPSIAQALTVFALITGLKERVKDTAAPGPDMGF